MTFQQSKIGFLFGSLLFLVLLHPSAILVSCKRNGSEALEIRSGTIIFKSFCRLEGRNIVYAQKNKLNYKRIPPPKIKNKNSINLSMYKQRRNKSLPFFHIIGVGKIYCRIDSYNQYTWNLTSFWVLLDVSIDSCPRNLPQNSSSGPCNL